MDPSRFDGTIHPHMWIKQIRSFCYLKQIKNEKDILEFCIGMVDVPIKNPEKIKTIDKLVEELKSSISFVVFKNSSQRKLNLLKYNTEREGGNTAKFVAEFRSLCFDAEINDLEEQKKYLFHALPNDYFRNTFINRKMDKINSLDDLIKMFEDIVQEESNLIRNGSCIAIKHVKTGKYLSSTTKYHQTGSGKQIVFAGQTLPDSDALWIIKASCDQISYNDMVSLQHKITNTLIGRESLTDPHYYNDYMDGDFADHVEVYCSTPSRTLQFNYHWMAQRINYTKYDSSYIRNGDIINIRNVKDNGFLRSHEYQITIYNETFQEVISHDKKLGENDEWCVELIENH